MLSGDIPAHYTLRLPAWVKDQLAGVPPVLPDVADRMRLVHGLAARNFVEGDGGPFAAVVSDPRSGEIVSVGVNVVLTANISSAHAEVVALSLAQARLGSWNLGSDGRDLEIAVNWRPCVQCYGATFWSGVTSLVIAGSGPELEEITGFDEGPMRDDWAERFRRKGIMVTDGVLRDEAIAVFSAYRDHVAATGATVYNAHD